MAVGGERSSLTLQGRRRLVPSPLNTHGETDGTGEFRRSRLRWSPGDGREGGGESGACCLFHPTQNCPFQPDAPKAVVQLSTRWTSTPLNRLVVVSLVRLCTLHCPRPNRSHNHRPGPTPGTASIPSPARASIPPGRPSIENVCLGAVKDGNVAYSRQNHVLKSFADGTCCQCGCHRDRVRLPGVGEVEVD